MCGEIKFIKGIKFMSVLKNKRTTSNVEFYNNAILLRKQITIFLLKDFGIKDKVRNLNNFTNIRNITENDKILLEEFMTKYKLGSKIYEEYPVWFLEEERRNIIHLLNELLYDIVHANTIYVRSISEYKTRRKYQTKAISICELLLQEFQYLIDILPININKLEYYIELIIKEIALLKGWRKSDNKILKRLLDKEKE